MTPVDYLPGILLAWSALFVALTSPGPSVVAIMGASLGAGRRAGLTMAGGVATGSFTWGALTAAGLSTFVLHYAWAMVALKIMGGAFLLWLAWKAFRAAASEADVAADAAKAAQRAGRVTGGAVWFRKGLAIHLTNPKAVMGWVATIALGLPEGAPLWVAATIVVGGWVMSLIVNGAYALFFSAPPMVRLYARGRRVIQAVMGSVFALAGLRLLASRA